MRILALEINQGGKRLFLVKFKVSDLAQLHQKGRIRVDNYQPMATAGEKGYQRGLDKTRAGEIAKFVRGQKEEDIFVHILPTALVFNHREGERLIFSNGFLEIDDGVMLHVIDGQHRLEGLISSDAKDFEVPVVVTEGLGAVKEAAQFLLINTTQKKVKPGLEYRVLSEIDPDQTNRLIDGISSRFWSTLGIDSWKMKAADLTYALNDQNESPWRNRLRREGETKRPGEWKPLSEGNFVDTLRFVCQGNHALRELTHARVKEYLITYWDAIRETYKDAFASSTGRRYLVCRSLGAGIFNVMAPAFYCMSNGSDKELRPLVEDFAKKFPLADWARGSREFAAQGNSQSARQAKAIEMFARAFPRFSLVDKREKKKIERKLPDIPGLRERTLRTALSLLSPLRVRPADGLDAKKLKDQQGCYVLLRRSGSVYVGKSNSASRRLSEHDTYEYYCFEPSGDDRKTGYLEQLLYHLVKKDFRENKIHPPPEDQCSLC